MLGTSRRDLLVNEACKVIDKHKFNKVDTFVFRGVSGALMAPILAYRYKKPLTVVRKERRKHSSMLVEGLSEALSYIIIDDCVDTGTTIRTIMRRMRLFAPSAECKGILLWSRYDDKEFEYLGETYQIYGLSK